MNTNSEHIELFARKLSGDLSQEELNSFIALLESSADLQSEFAAFENVWNGVDVIKNKPVVNTEKAWNRFVGEIQESGKKEKKFNFAPLYAAAAVVVFAVFSWVLIKNITPQADSRVQVATISAEQKQLSLPDNTSILLNENSSISYGEEYGHKERRISLQGEAFFEVTHNPEIPFIIEVNNARVEVRGTSFFIEQDTVLHRVTVLVRTGRVAFYNEGSADTIFLTKGQQGVINNNEIPHQNEVVNENFVAWKTKKMVFDSEPLSIVVQRINEAYYSNIQIEDSTLESELITTTIDNKTLSEVIEILELTIEHEISQENNSYIIRSKKL